MVESGKGVGRREELSGEPYWDRFSAEIERMRYRDGARRGYASRLHYFSEWISDGTRRGLVRDLGPELGAVPDRRPLRFMSEHRASYPALASDAVLAEIVTMERRLDSNDRHLIPTERIPEVADHIESGDVLAFATSIPGLDVTHAAFAHRSVDRIRRVLHAPLSGGVAGTGSSRSLTLRSHAAIADCRMLNFSLKS